MNNAENANSLNGAQGKRVSDKQAAKSVAYEMNASRNFRAWMAEHRCSLAFTTYQRGSLFLLGIQADGKLGKSVHQFSRCMGLYADPDKIWASSLHQIWRFSNHAGDAATESGVDRVYRPRVAYVTGDLDIHEMSVDASGQLVFVNTLYSCLATVSDTRSFKPLWRPSFVSKLLAEDRCHLNGLAMRDGQPFAVSAISTTDIAFGWREHRRDGGVVIDVASHEILAAGLSMPHSPRWALGKLWVLNSGEGGFGYIDSATGKFNEVTFCPGYARGVGIIGKYAVIGLSRPRENSSTFSGLLLGERLAKFRVSARCGLMIVDLETGSAGDWLRIEGSIQELFDVAIIAGVKRPTILGDPRTSGSELAAY
ncbi:TIGR03032 family protein [soil metagenome]